VELDGAVQTVWSRSTDTPGQHVTIGPISTAATTSVRVLWHYTGSYEYHWMVDNVVITGN